MPALALFKFIKVLRLLKKKMAPAKSCGSRRSGTPALAPSCASTTKTSNRLFDKLAYQYFWL